MMQIPNDLFFAWVESEVAEGRSVRFRAKGVSMHPLIRGGKDEILLSPCSDKKLKTTDVVLFKYKGQYVLHRIIHIEGNLLTLQGDGSFTAKEECTTEDVVGRVQAIIRPLGKVVYVDSWRWKLPSYIWSKIGIFKNPILRGFYYITQKM